MRKKHVVTALLLSSGSMAFCATGTSAQLGGETIQVATQESHTGSEEVGTQIASSSPEAVAAVPQPLPSVTRADALLAARACVHESTFRGGRGGTFDCGAQAQVIQTRRRPGETFSHTLLRTMPRFAAHTTSRSWVHELPDGPIRGEVLGWPYAYPARHDSDAWGSVFARVSDFMRGREPLPCAQPPEQWFGRRVDHEALQARLDSGRWREADCNPGGAQTTQTLNAYLTRIPLAERQVRSVVATR